jgi:hypothetical protein
MRRIATAQLSGICSMVQGRTLRHPHWPVDEHGVGLRLARGANSTWKVRSGVRVNVSSVATNDSQQNHPNYRGPDDHLGDAAGALGDADSSDIHSQPCRVRDLVVVSLTERRYGLDLADRTGALQATRWEDQPAWDSEVTATSASRRAMTSIVTRPRTPRPRTTAATRKPGRPIRRASTYEGAVRPGTSDNSAQAKAATRTTKRSKRTMRRDAIAGGKCLPLVDAFGTRGNPHFCPAIPTIPHALVACCTPAHWY